MSIRLNDKIIAGVKDSISTETDTNLTGVLTGNGTSVGSKAIDTSSLTNDNDHIPTSGVVKSALDSKVYAKVLSIGTNTITLESGTRNIILVQYLTNYAYLCGVVVQANGTVNVYTLVGDPAGCNFRVGGSNQILVDSGSAGVTILVITTK